jgi:hypothetical protein
MIGEDYLRVVEAENIKRKSPSLAEDDYGTKKPNHLEILWDRKSMKSIAMLVQNSS